MAYRYIDVHTHLNLEAFDEDGQSVGEHTRSEGVAYSNIGTGKETSEKAVAIAKEVNGVFAKDGRHPTHKSG